MIEYVLDESDRGRGNTYRFLLAAMQLASGKSDQCLILLFPSSDNITYALHMLRALCSPLGAFVVIRWSHRSVEFRNGSRIYLTTENGLRNTRGMRITDWGMDHDMAALDPEMKQYLGQITVKSPDSLTPL